MKEGWESEYKPINFDHHLLSSIMRLGLGGILYLGTCGRISQGHVIELSTQPFCLG